MSKELRTFEIRFQNNVVTISTDRSRLGTLEALVTIIFHEFHRKSPEEFDGFMMRMNLLHEFTKQRKEHIDGEPLNDNAFWRSADK
ncbi:hypothetical protein [Paenibacillus lemnae]|uniref:Uncharacterized protein n=1 Tax=Paenibacillus lemnae TaxID=1330551 RepID=A0A848MA36_PAELE|nr:hypothetical protein [Paenibacillus lemnae]NMO97456.1 hypothetical protein [Paenibacillus lemnae]